MIGGGRLKCLKQQSIDMKGEGRQQGGYSRAVRAVRGGKRGT
jgi:hypothetical protein